MPLVNYPVTLPPQQVEVTVPKRKRGAPETPPKEMQRSCEGALHLRPGPLFLTKDEMEYLKANRPEVHDKLQFLALTDAEKQEIQNPEPAKAPEATSSGAEEPSPPTQTTGGRKGSSKGS